MKEKIISCLRESADIKLQIAKESLEDIIGVTQTIQKAFKSGNKLLIFGNGGSAADSQHIAAEFVNRFMINRKALPAIALTTDSSVLTSIANDYSYINIFSRQIEALGKKGDIAWGISTSGKSANVIKAFETANELGLKTVVFTGKNINKLKHIIVNHKILVPSSSTQRIQEAHITVAHIICELVENTFSQQDNSKTR